jgi:hypothetical protein
MLLVPLVASGQNLGKICVFLSAHVYIKSLIFLCAQ